MGYVLEHYWQTGYSVSCVGYTTEGYWTTGYTGDCTDSETPPITCDITSEALVYSFVEDAPSRCYITSRALLLADPSSTSGSACDCAALEARIARLEILLTDYLKPEDIQPLFNKYIKEVIFDV